MLSKKKNGLTQIELKRQLNYDKETGEFTWKINKQGIVIGDVAGNFDVKSTRYIRITINYKRFQAHRLAWLYEYGYFPINHIDHVNHNRSDNRICNLRDVPRSENSKNCSLAKNNTSGAVGVRRRNNSWIACIGYNGKRIHIGSYKNIYDARVARKNAEIRYGFHANHGK